MVKTGKKSINLNSRVAKYYLAKKQWATGKESLKIAGYSEKSNQQTAIENTKQYKEIQEYFKDHLLKEISLKEISQELKKNIIQDQDKGAKNTAIKLALDKIEPDNINTDEDKEIYVVLKPKEVKIVEPPNKPIEGQLIE